jgi:hypothetical protein
MANVVIVSTTNTIQITWNSAGSVWASEVWHKASVHFFLERTALFVEAREDNGTSTAFTFDGAQGDQIDTIDGIAPTSNLDLYNKLMALIA